MERDTTEFQGFASFWRSSLIATPGDFRLVANRDHQESRWDQRCFNFFCYLWNSSQTESMILICLRWCLRDPGLAPVDMKRRREELYRHDIDLPPSLSICPVCGTSVSKENIGIHVEEHFTQPSTSSEANRFDELGEMSIFEARFSTVKSILKASSRYVGSRYNKVCFCLISVPGFSDTVDFRECNYGRCQQIG